MNQPAVSRKHRFMNGLFVVAGTMFLGLGAIGIVLPVLPTTPFLLLAAACYLRGSERMHQWLLNNRWFGSYIRNYHEGKGISAKGKIFSISTLWITICFSAFLIRMAHVQILLFIIATAVTVHLIMVPTFRE
jgi:uncharacterized membrane protein YbaN (DUF454 family)